MACERSHNNTLPILNPIKMHKKTFSRIIILLLPVLYGTNAYSQSSQEGLPIVVGYLGHYAIQPGIKIGTEIPFKTWEKERTRKKGNITRVKRFSVNPQLAWFTRINQDANYWLNAEVMYKVRNKERGFYTAFTAGVGYLLQSKVASFSVNLATGEKTNKQRASSHFLLPSLGFELGGNLSSQLGWYNKYTWGQRFFSGNGNGSTMSVFVELGVKWYLFKN